MREQPPYQELSRSIKGKTALITGAASGMGRATAHLFAREGANVAVTDLRQENVDNVVNEIKAAGFDHVKGWALDVGDGAAIKRVVDEAAAHFGGMDILVNNAGFAIPGQVGEESYEDSWGPSINVMLTSHQRAIRAALPYMRKNGWGRIVNIASTEGLGATPGNSPYVAAKHGVIGLTRGLAVDLGREGITVNCICPGPIITGITAGISDEHKEIYAKRRVPLRRYGIPEEVAHMTLSLVLPAASFLNGVHIPVDGGLTIKNA
ncbi:3-oxoacyl-ACP reductase [Hyphomonas sp. CACIAM 19H1]|uniref:SDR family NAD(P)-dependent oxidoreductase n=1 Tax=Hyphomonas sp. CACIAM 19H1 TaxID=1873716 RepID=UPI000DED6752|nr:SDR family NAD(P)-dependent oxidoreductase [Hyphomonas sp. CACIAM 19H1]AXE65352.1 3-oxoacyl-ACP reductase [Hyphomonas sp. CACIAM 19H1]